LKTLSDKPGKDFSKSIREISLDGSDFGKLSDRFSKSSALAHTVKVALRETEKPLLAP
jgi:hypothetical protein